LADDSDTGIVLKYVQSKIKLREQKYVKEIKEEGRDLPRLQNDVTEQCTKFK